MLCTKLIRGDVGINFSPRFSRSVYCLLSGRFGVVYDFVMVDGLFVLSEKMFLFRVVCHMFGDGDGNVLMDAAYNAGGLYPVRSIDISEQGRDCCVLTCLYLLGSVFHSQEDGVIVSCLISMIGKGFLTV